MSVHTVSTFRHLIDAAATRHGLEPRVVCAQVQVESTANPWAWNPEPKYRWFWDVRLKRPFRALDPSEIARKAPPADFHCYAGDPDQEWWGQQASWGLLQVMGAVARELGFTGDYLSQLCEPVLNLELGCTKLGTELTKTGDIRSALARYNGGPKGNAPGGPLRNEPYVQKVEKAMRFFA